MLPPTRFLTMEFKIAYISGLIEKVEPPTNFKIIDIPSTYITSATALNYLFNAYYLDYKASLKKTAFPMDLLPSPKPLADREFYMVLLENKYPGFISIFIRAFQTWAETAFTPTTYMELLKPQTDTNDLIAKYFAETKAEVDTTVTLGKRSVDMVVTGTQIIIKLLLSFSNQSKHHLMALVTEMHMTKKPPRRLFVIKETEYTASLSSTMKLVLSTIGLEADAYFPDFLRKAFVPYYLI